MMFLMVENAGEADVRAFTKLGLSESRGKSDKIGQFGSGAKHGILTLMREGLNPTIYCGKTKVEFFSQPNTMGATAYNDMFVKVGTKAPVELSFCLEFGAIDWTDVNMGLRELVSNAIDNCEGDVVANVAVKIVDNPRAKSGFTRAFVPLTPTVQQFANSLSERFLHFSDNATKTIIPKSIPGKARVYRKGVFVREVDAWYENSLFDYNLGESLQIDECRNSNDWDCQREIGKAISNDRATVELMFRKFIAGEYKSFEAKMSDYHLNGQSWWKEVWESLVGTDGVILGPSSQMAEFVAKKGKVVYTVPSGWYDAMEHAGIVTGLSCLSKVENKGFTVVPATPKTVELTNKIWSWLVDLHMTNGKDKPQCACFSKVLETETKGVLFGYYEKDSIYINLDYQENIQTYVEELAHHITGAADGTREFQEFAFQIATRLAEVVYN